MQNGNEMTPGDLWIKQKFKKSLNKYDKFVVNQKYSRKVSPCDNERDGGWGRK